MHKNATAGRWHYVSLPVSLALGRNATLAAQKFSGDLPQWGDEWHDVTLFYPGQVSWPYVNSKNQAGAESIRQGKPAIAHHSPLQLANYGVEAEFANEIFTQWLADHARRSFDDYQHGHRRCWNVRMSIGENYGTVSYNTCTPACSALEFWRSDNFVPCFFRQPDGVRRHRWAVTICCLLHRAQFTGAWLMYIRRRAGETLWEGGSRFVVAVLAVIGSLMVALTGTLGGALAGFKTIFSGMLRSFGWKVYTTYYVPDFSLILLLVISAALVGLGFVCRKKTACQLSNMNLISYQKKAAFIT